MTPALAAIAILYARGWYRMSKTLPNLIPVWRSAAFGGGLVALWVALRSPLAELDEQLLSAHMAQHLLLMTVAAPLILLGAPSITLLHGLPRRFVRDTLGPLIRWRPLQRLADICTRPTFCWLAGAGVVIGWHVPAAFELALRSHHWHEIAHVSFLAAGLLFWWPVIRPWPSVEQSPRWSIPLYLFLATLPCDALSAFLAFCDQVVYRPYRSAEGAFHLTALQDQALAGALMWVVVTFVYLFPALIVTVQILTGTRIHRRTGQASFRKLA